MGCGCKNKGNQTQQATTNTVQTNNISVQPAATVNEDIKQTIRKTVEKYYNVTKTTNGWIKE
jgi:hypothetical protein